MRANTSAAGLLASGACVRSCEVSSSMDRLAPTHRTLCKPITLVYRALTRKSTQECWGIGSCGRVSLVRPFAEANTVSNKALSHCRPALFPFYSASWSRAVLRAALALTTQLAFPAPLQGVQPLSTCRLATLTWEQHALPCIAC